MGKSVLAKINKLNSKIDHLKQINEKYPDVEIATIGNLLKLTSQHDQPIFYSSLVNNCAEFSEIIKPYNRHSYKQIAYLCFFRKDFKYNTKIYSNPIGIKFYEDDRISGKLIRTFLHYEFEDMNHLIKKAEIFAIKDALKMKWEIKYDENNERIKNILLML